MAKVKDQIAQLGMATLVAGLKAVESGVSKKQYKRKEEGHPARQA
jgi:hypothetical protein